MKILAGVCPCVALLAVVVSTALRYKRKKQNKLQKARRLFWAEVFWMINIGFLAASFLCQLLNKWSWFSFALSVLVVLCAPISAIAIVKKYREYKQLRDNPPPEDGGK